MTYFPNFHFLGCLPEGDGVPNGYETAAEAWRDLINSLGDAAWAPDDDADGPQSLKLFVTHMEALEAADLPGSVFGDNGVYEVEWIEEYVEVPC